MKWLGFVLFLAACGANSPTCPIYSGAHRAACAICEHLPDRCPFEHEHLGPNEP